MRTSLSACVVAAAGAALPAVAQVSVMSAQHEVAVVANGPPYGVADSDAAAGNTAAFDRTVAASFMGEGSFGLTVSSDAQATLTSFVTPTRMGGSVTADLISTGNRYDTEPGASATFRVAATFMVTEPTPWTLQLFEPGTAVYYAGSSVGPMPFDVTLTLAGDAGDVAAIDFFGAAGPDFTQPGTLTLYDMLHGGPLTPANAPAGVLAPGTYTFTYGGTSLLDDLTLVLPEVALVVPEPAATAALGLAWLPLRRRR